MTRNELILALRRLKVETGSLACMGCGHEHNCCIHGCAILCAAIELLQEKIPEAEPPGIGQEPLQISRPHLRDSCAGHPAKAGKS